VLNPDLELTFLGRIPSKKNNKRHITRTRKGEQARFTVPSELHRDWHRSEFLSLVRQLPDVLEIAQAVDPFQDFSDLSYQGESGESQLIELIKQMRPYEAVYPWPYRLEYEFWPGDLRLFDLSNAVESVNDLLVDLRILQDDSWAYLRDPDPTVKGFAKGEEHCVVRLYCLPRTPADDALEALRDKEVVKTLAQQNNLSQKAMRQELEAMLSWG